MKHLRPLKLFSILLLFSLTHTTSAQTEPTAAWQVTRFDITATLPASGADERTLAARADLTARNVGQGIGRTFTVRLSPTAEIKSVNVGGATATFVKREDSRTQTQMAQISLPSSFPPNATVNVIIDYNLPLTGPVLGKNSGLAAISPEGAQFLPLSFWYPAPNTPYAVRGADFAPVRLTVNAPAGTTVMSSGQMTGATFDQKLAAQPFFLTGKWETIEGTGDARGISAHTFTGASADERKQAEQLIAFAAAARAYFATLFGPAPDVPVRLVAARRGAGFDTGGTVLLDAASFRRSKVDATTAVSIAEAVARLWLGGIAPVRGEGSGVVREGLVRYLVTLFLEKQFGRDAADAERLRERIAYAGIAGRDAPLAQATQLDQNYFTSVANKGAMLWRLVERTIGRDVFTSLLRTQMQTGEVTLASLRAALNERGGATLKSLLDTQLDQPNELDLQVGLPQQRGADWVAALRNTGAQTITVPVVALTDTGQRLVQDVTIPANDFGEVHFKTAAKLVRTEIDPDKLYPQIDYANDTAPRAPSLLEALAEARRFYGAGDFARAETVARTLLQAAPLLQEARIELARALLEQNRLPDAEQEFRAALDDKLPLPTALAWGAYGLAEIAQRKGQATEAARRYDEAVRTEGGYAATLAARTARLKNQTAPAPDESVKQFFTQLDQAIKSGRKAEIDALVMPGELSNFSKGFVATQPEIWQTKVLRTEPTGGDRVMADVQITARSDNRDKTITAVFSITRAGGQWRLMEIPIFEER